MGSLKYELSTCERFLTLERLAKEHTIAKRALAGTGQKAPKQETATLNSLKQYKNAAIKFGIWCKTKFGTRHMEDCRPHIQAYADYLTFAGKSASTIHTYLAGVCCAFGVPMDTIHKPLRHTADNVRSRGPKKSHTRTDTKREVAPRLYDFAEHVGIRRHEYKALHGSDFARDECGYLCVVIRKGKGGKPQLQRVTPGKEEFILRHFDGSETYVFSEAEMENKIDLHHLRGLAAQHAYYAYLGRLQTNPAYRARLEEEVRNRFYAGHKHGAWNYDKVRGNYRTRGKNRELALKSGIPADYDRLAVMAVSVFHLSHWRAGVTVANYLLAVSPDMVRPPDGVRAV